MTNPFHKIADLVPFDDGRMFVANEYAQAFASRSTFAEAVSRPFDNESILRRRESTEGWDNLSCKLEMLPSEGPASQQAVFGKRHFNTFAGQIEATAIATCVEAGIPAMKLVAVGWSETPQPSVENSCVQSFVLTEAVGQGVSVFDSLQNVASLEEAENVLRPAAQVLARLHIAELSHNDCQLDHFIYDTNGDLRLIDLQGLRSGHQGRRRRWKDLAIVRLSLIATPLSCQLIPVWWDAYREACRVAGECDPGIVSRLRVAMLSDLRLAKSSVRYVKLGMRKQAIQMLTRRFGYGTRRAA